MAIPKNKVDRAKREDAAHAAILAARREKRIHEVRLARLFRTMDQSLAFVYFAAASVAEYGARFGYSSEEARALADVGHALEILPAIEERLLDGRLTFDAAAVLSRIILNAEFAGKHDEWLKLAEKADVAELKRRVRQAVAEAAAKEPVVPKTVFLTEQDEKDFFDARGLASRKANRVLGEGETIGILSRFYLDELDPLRAKPGTRRVPDTRTVEGRYIPMEVRRAVYERTGGKCAVWLCPNRWFLDNAHLFAHSKGGHREASGISPLCGLHHEEHDAGLLIIEGTAEHPIFKDAQGNLLPGGPDPPDTG